MIELLCIFSSINSLLICFISEILLTIFEISLGSTTTRSLKKGRHVYDILVSSGSTIYRMVEGDILVQGGISSAP